MSELTMYRDNTKTVEVWVTLNGVGVDLTGCALWFTVKALGTWKTDPDSASLFQLSTGAGSVSIVPTGSTWSAGAAHLAGDLVMPIARNGLCYVTQGGGTSGSSEPAWPLLLGGAVSDGSVVWTCAATTGHAEATILPAATRALTTDARFEYDWTLLDAGGVLTTIELGTLRVLANVTRAGDVAP